MTPANPCLVSPFAKPDSGTRPKNSAYPLNRRPAGGLSRPLPSPGNLGLCIFHLELLQNDTLFGALKEKIKISK